jgi:hypothetical protein
MRFFFVLSACLALGCTEDDPTLYLTGTEEFAVKTADGEYVCESPKKELICHVPPGNPDNAHTICVGAAAVDAHAEHHGDAAGACEGDVPDAPDAGAEDPDDGSDGGDTDPPDSDAGSEPIIE